MLKLICTVCKQYFFIACTCQLNKMCSECREFTLSKEYRKYLEDIKLDQEISKFSAIFIKYNSCLCLCKPCHKHKFNTDLKCNHCDKTDKVEIKIISR